MSRRRPSRIHGLLPIYKRPGPTSHDVVDMARKALRERRVGHTGTLDPMAEGLLLLCVGQATRLQQYLLLWDKTYRGEVKLGHATTTYDGEGEAQDPADTPPKLDRATLDDLVPQFRGEIEQVPPPYSAKKVAGKKLYELARETVAEYPVYQPVHNVLFLATTELGFVGGALWLGLLVAPWLALWAKRHQLSMGPWWAGLSGALVGLYVVGFFDHYPWSSHQGRLLLWLVWGLWAGEWTRDTKLEKTV